jgi:mRNA interferase HigB
MVGRCVVFNIGGNKYRLIARILFAKQRVYILKVMTHSEYDEDKWKAECYCFERPPEGNADKRSTARMGKARKNLGRKENGR